MDSFGYETITLFAFIAIGIACVGCLAAGWIGEVYSRKDVITYDRLNELNPPAFQASPRATEGQRTDDQGDFE